MLLPLNNFVLFAEIMDALREVEIGEFIGCAMEHTRSGSDILVRIDPGEEIHAALRELADDLGFDAKAFEEVSKALESGRPAAEIEPVSFFH